MNDSALIFFLYFCSPKIIRKLCPNKQTIAEDSVRAVLGALMIDKDAYAVVCEMLLPESFYEPRNQKVYRAIMELSMHELPVDVWTVTEQLAKQGDLEDVGGPGYVTELSSRVASSANIEYHARIIAQKSLARQLISFSSNIQTKAFDDHSLSWVSET